MNKTNLELRKILIRMHKMGKSVAEISKITEIKIRTVYNYLKNQKNDENILSDPPKNTRKPSLELDKLQKYIVYFGTK